MKWKEQNSKSVTSQTIRKSRSIVKNQTIVRIRLAYQPPLAWDEMLAFLALRAIPGVESVTDQVYRRTVSLRNRNRVYRGWISVANLPERNSLCVRFASSLLPVLAELRTRIRCLFDLNCNPTEIYEKLKIMNELRPNLCVAGLRLPGCFDPFELSVRAVLGQQVTVKAARTLAMRFAAAFGKKIRTPFADLNLTFPNPDRIDRLTTPIENHLGPLGIIGSRARAIFALTEALMTGSFSLSQSAEAENAMEKLLKLPGFGSWTVQYIGMRALGQPDAFPHTDYGVKKALPGLTPREILLLSQNWSPWRSYATFMLWNSLTK